jgi:hypothetical protein
MARSRVALVLVAALALGACGSDEGPKQRFAEPLGQKLGGSVASLANCSDWAGGPRDRKLATIADIRSQVNRDDTGIEAPPLSDDEAMKLFDGECAKPYAKGFRLYVIYARAAGWAPLLR